MKEITEINPVDNRLTFKEFVVIECAINDPGLIIEGRAAIHFKMSVTCKSIKAGRWIEAG